MDVSGAVVKLALIAIPGIIGSAVYRKLRGRRQKQAWEDFVEVLLFSVLSYAVLSLCVNSTVTSSKPSDSPTPTHVGQTADPLPTTAVSQSTTQTTTAPTTNPTTSPAAPASSLPATPPTTLPGTQPTTAPSVAASTQPTTQPSAFILDRLLEEKVPIAWSQVLVASFIGVALAYLAAAIHNFQFVNRLGHLLRVSKRAGDEDVWSMVFGAPRTLWVIVRDDKAKLTYFGYAERYSESEKRRELHLQQVSVYSENAQLLYETPHLYVCREPADISVEVPRQPPPPRGKLRRWIRNLRASMLRWRRRRGVRVQGFPNE